MLRGAARRAGARPLVSRPRSRRCPGDTTLSARHAGARDRVHHEHWFRGGDRIHAATQRRVGPGPAGRRPARAGGNAHHPDPALRLRFRGALGQSARGWCPARRGGAGYGHPAHAGGGTRRGIDDAGRLLRGRRRDGAVRAFLCGLASGGAQPHRPYTRPGRHRGVLGRMVFPRRCGRAMDRGGPAVADHAQGADLQPDRRDRGRTHHFAAGASGRPAQPGTTASAGCATRPSPFSR